jgi:hypothetical protein
MKMTTSNCVAIIPFAQDPMIYGMKLSYRLKREKEIHNLWFENQTIPSFISYMIKAKMFDWHEWKSTSALIPESYVPKAPSKTEAIYPSVWEKNHPSPQERFSSSIIYTLEFSFQDDAKIQCIEFTGSIPDAYFAFVRPLCEFWSIKEKLDNPTIKFQNSFVMEQTALCVCSETGIKFAIDMNLPAHMQFDMLHPLAIKRNVDQLISKLDIRGEDIAKHLQPTILAGIVISLLKSAHLFAIHELSASECNTRLVAECQPELMAKFISWFHSQKSSLTFPSIHLTGEYRLDWQLMNYLRILKNEDPTVGQNKSAFVEPSFKVTVVKSIPIAKRVKAHIDNLVEELDKSSHIFLFKLKAKFKFIETMSQEAKDKLYMEIENELPLNSDVEGLLEILEQSELSDLTEDDLFSVTDSGAPGKINLMDILKKKLGDKNEQE